MKFIALLLLLSYSLSWGQDFNNYQPIRNQGELPNDFTTRTSEKVRNDISTQIEYNENQHVKRSKTEFLLKSNYMIDELLMSGKVLFGDPVSEYVNKVADKVLIKEPELRKELRFYCIKSTITNAFTTNQGMIFVTLGLISQLENEAQLAFVLAHEITHYKRKHMINSFLEADRAMSRKGKYSQSSYDDNIIKLSNYSKTLEFESDSVGFYIMEEAGYNIKAALTVFDVLQFSYLPFDEQPFDISFFESDNFKIPQKFYLDTILPIQFDDNYDDSKSTHPNIKKRKDKINTFIDKTNSKKDNVFLVSKDNFFNIREISRFETVRNNLINQDYVTAIYNSLILKKKHPESSYLDNSIAKALYGIYKYKVIGKEYHIVKDYDYYEGEISRAFYLFEGLNEKQTGSIALKYIWNLYQKNKNPYIKLLLDNLVETLIQKTQINFEEYKSKEYIEAYKDKVRQDSIADAQQLLVDKTIDSTSSDNKEENKKLSKYEKLRKIKADQEKQVVEDIVNENQLNSDEFYIFAISDVNNYNGLKQEFDGVSVKLKSEKEKDFKDSEEFKKLSDYEQRKMIYKQNKKKHKEELHIRADKIVFIDPDYISIDERNGVKLINSEDMQYEFYNQINYAAKKAKIESEILSAKLLNNQQTNKFNHISMINDWINEVSSIEEASSDWTFIPSESEYILPLIDTLGTEHISFTLAYVYKDIKDNKGGVLAATILYPIFLPYGIYYAVTPRYYSGLITKCFNLRTGSTEIDKTYEIKTKATKGSMNSFIYDFLYQIQK